MWGAIGAPLGIARVDPTARVCPTALARAWAANSTRTAPAQASPWGPRLGWQVCSPWGVNGILGPRQGRAHPGVVAGTIRTVW